MHSRQSKADGAWIKIYPETRRSGGLADLYAEHEDAAHRIVDSIPKIHSLKPPTLRDHGNLHRTSMHSASELSRIEGELIAVVDSS